MDLESFKRSRTWISRPRCNQPLSRISATIHVISDATSFILSTRRKFLLFHTVWHWLEATSNLCSPDYGILLFLYDRAYPESRHGFPRRSPIYAPYPIPIYLSCISPCAAFSTITLYVLLPVSHARTSALSCGTGRNLSRVDLRWELGGLVVREAAKVWRPCKRYSFPDLFALQTLLFVLRLSNWTSHKYTSIDCWGKATRRFLHIASAELGRSTRIDGN